jgi:hypothetical protein
MDVPVASGNNPCSQYGIVGFGVQASLLDNSWQRSEKILEHGPIEGLDTYCLYSEYHSAVCDFLAICVIWRLHGL